MDGLPHEVPTLGKLDACSLGISWAVVPEAFHLLPPGADRFLTVHVLTTASKQIDSGIGELLRHFQRFPEVTVTATRVDGFTELRSEDNQFAFEEVLYCWMLECRQDAGPECGQEQAGGIPTSTSQSNWEKQARRLPPPLPLQRRQAGRLLPLSFPMRAIFRLNRRGAISRIVNRRDARPSAFPFARVTRHSLIDELEPNAGTETREGREWRTRHLRQCLLTRTDTRERSAYSHAIRAACLSFDVRQEA